MKKFRVALLFFKDIDDDGARYWFPHKCKGITVAFLKKKEEFCGVAL